jgi:hypothetical protein
MSHPHRPVPKQASAQFADRRSRLCQHPGTGGQQPPALVRDSDHLGAQWSARDHRVQGVAARRAWCRRAGAGRRGRQPPARRPVAP